MKPIIGIIMRQDKLNSGNKISYIYTDIETSIIKSGGIPIGISRDKIKDYLNICNGFILQGGSEFTKEDFTSINTIKRTNKPLLGICLGMQEMAYIENGCIKDIPNHLNTTHEIKIIKDSLLYKILNKDKIIVNSRHKSAIIKTNLFVSSISNDNIIESIEDKNHKFYLGIEWHPENTYNIDINSQKIFDYFIKVCQDN